MGQRTRTRVMTVGLALGFLGVFAAPAQAGSVTPEPSAAQSDSAWLCPPGTPREGLPPLPFSPWPCGYVPKASASVAKSTAARWICPPGTPRAGQPALPLSPWPCGYVVVGYTSSADAPTA